MRTVRKCYETLRKHPAVVVSAHCAFIADDYNSRLKSTLDSVAPLVTETFKYKLRAPWRNDKVKHVKI